jgi:hypothetical protein
LFSGEQVFLAPLVFPAKGGLTPSPFLMEFLCA